MRKNYYKSITNIRILLIIMLVLRSGVYSFTKDSCAQVQLIAGFGKRNVRGVFGPDFGSYVMTI
jgi:hypothetical protein